MNPRQVLETYDAHYASTYNQRFLLNEASRVPSEREIGIIRELLSPESRWLDVACGTGYVLSRFPGVSRAGLDLSPAMLRIAGAANPDALFFREGDFRDPVPEWVGRWSLVTCMWYSYGLVESIADVRQVIRNLADWTSEQGVCFVPLCDPAILSAGTEIPYRAPRKVAGGTVLITGVIWSWIEESGKRHENMVAPQIEHMVAMFREHFGVVEVIDYPLASTGWRSRFLRRSRSARRKALVARARKPFPPRKPLSPS